MNKLNNFKHSSFERNEGDVESQNRKESKNKLEKVLCNHCGRTISNGIRCLGICVADNEY